MIFIVKSILALIVIAGIYAIPKIITMVLMEGLWGGEIKYNGKAYKIVSDEDKPWKNKVEALLEILFWFPLSEILFLSGIIIYYTYKMLRWIVKDSGKYFSKKFEWWTNLPDE